MATHAAPKPAAQQAPRCPPSHIRSRRTGARQSGTDTPRGHQTSRRRPNPAGRDPSRSTLAHDLAQLPIFSPTGPAIQAKLEISQPGDPHEKEADRVAHQIMRMDAGGQPHTPAIQRLGNAQHDEIKTRTLQRACTTCEEEEIQRKAAPTSPRATGHTQSNQLLSRLDAVTGGAPLNQQQRAFFEPRFGADFSRVRIHTGPTADQAARSVGARAYTRGQDIVFGTDQFHPHTPSGQELLAHELTHVVQQGAAPAINAPTSHATETTTTAGIQRVSPQIIQRWPGDGMVPPGDCSWSTYAGLRGAVEAAKTLVDSLGGCRIGDTCQMLALKIAAIAAEIAARVALDTTCFRGGNTGHRQQVQDKVNRMIRCYRFFARSNCSQQLMEAMEAVVERALEVIAALAKGVVAVVLIIAMIAAVILLAKALAAAAAGAAAGAAIAAVVALLMVVMDQLSPDDTSGA